ncbi:MAG: oligopeptide ABC transporter permease [Mycobacterium leprae]
MATEPARKWVSKKAAPGSPPKDGLGLWQIAWRRLKRNRRAMVGFYILIFLSLLAVLAPFLTTHPYDQVDMTMIERPPSSLFWLGTDDLGRDVFSRLLFGGRISLSVGVVVAGIDMAIGIFLGSIAGFYGRTVDNLIMRFTDVVLMIPFLPLALTMAAILKPSVYNTMIILGCLSWPGTARLVRGEFLTLRKRDFVEAATSEGAQDGRIIFRHLLPNAMAPILVAATLAVATAILAEAGLSFLGFGVQQPIPSWGNMLSAALSLKVLVMQPWLWIPPGACIFIAVLSVNMLGDGLRDAMDPRLKE